MRNTNRVGISVQFDRDQKEQLTYLFGLHGLTFSAGLRLLGYEYLEQNKKSLENYVSDEQKQAQSQNLQFKTNHLNKLLNGDDIKVDNSSSTKSSQTSEAPNDAAQVKTIVNDGDLLKLYDTNGNYIGLETDTYLSQEEGSLAYAKDGKTPLGNFKNHKFNPYPHADKTQYL